jgi:hypothetical protein
MKWEEYSYWELFDRIKSPAGWDITPRGLAKGKRRFGAVSSELKSTPRQKAAGRRQLAPYLRVTVGNGQCATPQASGVRPHVPVPRRGDA